MPENKMLTGILLIIILTGGCLGLGFAARLGALKRSFITKGIPGVHPRNLVYALIPLGIFFFSLLASFFVDEYIFNILFYGAIILILISLMWQPRWLKPAWLRWLEDNYGHVLEEMFEEARQMGAHNWEAQVKTQVDLERWADSVAEKHGWQRLGERQ